MAIQERKERGEYDKSIFLFMLICLVMLSSCGNSYMDEFEDKNPVWSDYNIYAEGRYGKNIFAENIAVPKGMVCSEHYIYIVSSKDDCVHKFDFDGNHVLTFGELGSGLGKLDNPISIAFCNGIIFVANQSGGYVQAYDEDGNSLESYFISELNDNELSVMDLEVNEDGLYVSVIGSSLKKLRIYNLDFNGKKTVIGDGKIGVLGKNEDDRILFAQAYQFVDNGKEKGCEAGKSYVGTIVDDYFQFQFNLVDGFTPTKIEVFDGEIYLYSYSTNSVIRFSIEGDYLETIYEEEPSRENGGMFHFAMNDYGEIFISDMEKNLVYRIVEEQ